MIGYFAGLAAAAILVVPLALLLALNSAESFLLGVILGLVLPTVGALLDE